MRIKACAGVYNPNKMTEMAHGKFQCRWYPTPTLMTNKKVMIMVRERGKTCYRLHNRRDAYFMHLDEASAAPCMRQGGTNRTNERADSFGAWTFEVINYFVRDRHMDDLKGLLMTMLWCMALELRGKS
jgi:hypothetical protein